MEHRIESAAREELLELRAEMDSRKIAKKD